MLRRRLWQFARWHLSHSRRVTVSHGDCTRLGYWGATGNQAHGDPYTWAFDP
jgi:hypothetical protein